MLHTLLYLIFILSGAAGLIYESIWSRYLGLFVGHSAYAQIIVLTIFLGGMSLGAMLVGRRSERLREPLLWYAWVELAIGLIGLVFHDVYLAVTGVAYDVLFPALAGTGMLTAAKWALASALILPQSILLGMTFPLMSAGALRLAARRPGRVLALLYFANSLGAAVGVLVAGFYLIAVAGLPGTLLTAAMINLVVTLATLFVVRRARQTSEAGAEPARAPRAQTAAAAPDVTPVPTPVSGIAPGRLWKLLLLVSFGTAVASFIYEIAWIRMLSLVLGSATHSFELMLSAFILGLALGSFWVRRRADRFRDPVRALGIVQWLMGAAALATLPLYLASFEWTADLIAALDTTEQGYTLFNLARYALCLVVMLPATFCAGITLPLITRTLLAAGMGERAVGMVYGINTLGSIVGVIVAGLVLLPLVGLKTLLIEGAILDMALGVLLFRVSDGGTVRARRLAYAAALAMFAVGMTAMARNDFDRNLLTSGVFRHGRLPNEESRQVLFYRDGRTATVSAGRLTADQTLFIATNGKPDASLDSAWFRPKGSPMMETRTLEGDVSTQVLLPLITLAHAPGARTAAVIGQGSGMSSHFLLGSPALERLVTIEIEPQMIEGSRLFYPANRRVFDDPRSQFVIDDAKSFFAAERRQYDLILSEPSNPWVSGVSGLFTAEFYDRVKRYLANDGVFGQWLHLYEIDDGLVLSVLAALHQNFGAYEIFFTSTGDILIVASKGARLRVPDWSVFSRPAIANDLRHAAPFTPRTLEAMRLFHRDALAPLLDNWGQPNSDFFPVLDLGTERTRYRRVSARGFNDLPSGRFDIVAPFFGRRSDFSGERHVPTPGVARPYALSLGATLRHARANGWTETPTDRTAAAALHRYWRLEQALKSEGPPADWRLWLQDALVVEADVHGGTAGVVDEGFYERVTRFLHRHKAPPEAHHAVAFLRGLSAWDFPAASRAANPLLQPAVDGKSWVPVDVLRDGAVVAKLRTGDVVGATQYFDSLAARSERQPGDLRTRLLASYITALAPDGQARTASGVSRKQ